MNREDIIKNFKNEGDEKKLSDQRKSNHLAGFFIMVGVVILKIIDFLYDNPSDDTSLFIGLFFTGFFLSTFISKRKVVDFILFVALSLAVSYGIYNLIIKYYF